MRSQHSVAHLVMPEEHKERAKSFARMSEKSRQVFRIFEDVEQRPFAQSEGNADEQWSQYDEFFREEDKRNLSLKSKETKFGRSEHCVMMKRCLHQHAHMHEHHSHHHSARKWQEVEHSVKMLSAKDFLRNQDECHHENGSCCSDFDHCDGLEGGHCNGHDDFEQHRHPCHDQYHHHHELQSFEPQDKSVECPCDE